MGINKQVAFNIAEKSILENLLMELPEGDLIFRYAGIKSLCQCSKNADQSFRVLTLAILFQDGVALVGAALQGRKDQYCKRTGKIIALRRLLDKRIGTIFLDDMIKYNMSIKEKDVKANEILDFGLNYIPFNMITKNWYNMVSE